MDLSLSPDEREFRDRLRAWLDEHPPGVEPKEDRAGFEFRLRWQQQLHAAGWTGLHWPAEYGGRGVTPIEQAIYEDEMARVGAPEPANIAGTFLMGPLIIRYGTDQQKRDWLEPILSGEEIWCEGYSEPGAGSDLGSVQTRAVRDGDEWVVTGQKVWTSYAQHASVCLLLARTDPDASKLGGLTVFRLEMDQPGVEVRPLRQITGIPEFNELFLDGARIPVSNTIGGEGNGWKMIMSALGFARANVGISLVGGLRTQMRDLSTLAIEYGVADDPVVRQRLAQLQIEVEALRLTAWRGLAERHAGARISRETSITKWQWSEISQSIADLAMEIRGLDVPEDDQRWATAFLHSRGTSIMGGTNEIQRNVVAEQVLGLPRAR